MLQASFFYTKYSKIQYSIPESHTILLAKIVTAMQVCKLIKSTIVMKWYEILLTIPVIIIGAYIRGKIYENKRNYFKNDSWKKRKKE